MSPRSASYGARSPRRPAQAGPDGRVAVGLWLVRLPTPHATGLRLAVDELDAGERARAASFLRPRDALLWIAAHIALRRLLAATLGLTPQEVAYDREPCRGCGGPHGRPVLRPGPGARGGEPAVHFSLSHSGGRALVAVAAAPVGVDIQRTPPARTAQVCVHRLHPGERAELEDLPPDRLGAAFGQLWARKEAYLKGIGTGLERPPRADYLGTPGQGRRLRPPGWTVLDLRCGPAHSAAVAVRGTPADRCPVHPLPARWLYEADAAPVLAEMAEMAEKTLRTTETAATAHLTTATRVKETHT
ncbi:4'-phosphopantetheinyl transferase family protein [Streptomyces sp. NPDC058335]|uniref:4'-phosphopantetheinyl transferase family protein n=1 Tax=Streptomyces sp. NPDC058335 TaxID=3346451 RepID=UPI0036666967